jgi:hypothetical protein
MRTIIFLSILIVTKSVLGQDYSTLGKKLGYSDEYRKAEKHRDINKALQNPEQILFLELIVDKEGKNYKIFIDNQSKFTNLRKLIIDNRWYQLDLHATPDLSNYKNLEFLQIYTLPKLNFDQLEELTNLKYLALINCNLKYLPASVLRLQQLEVLDLTLNYLNTIPDSIYQITSLKELDLTNNCFKEIPAQLATLTQLSYLELDNAELSEKDKDDYSYCYNQIAAYPAILAEFKSLKTLHLYKVNINDEMRERLKSDFKNIKFTF